MGANHHYVQAIQPQQIKLAHSYFQRAHITADQKGKYIKSHIRCQQKQYKAWKSKVLPSTSEIPISHQYLYLPIKSQFQYDTGYCSNTGLVVNLYPFFQSTLSQEIQKRASEKNYFKQSELWYLLYVLTAAKIDINKVGERVGDIKPLNIFIDSNHKLKVGNLFSGPFEQTNYYKLISTQSNLATSMEVMNKTTAQGHPKQSVLNLLLAPEDIDEAKRDLVNNKGNYKSQIFSIGATILSTGLLDNLQEVYDYKKIEFKLDIWKDKLNEWIAHPKYSEIFKSIILNLIDIDQIKRIQLPVLWAFISRYHLSINGKQPFIIVNPPECLQKGIQTIRNKKIQNL